MRYVKAFGLSLLVALSAMALSAAAASAGELAGDFLVNENLLAPGTQETVTGALEDWENSSLLVPTLNFAIRCHELDVTGGTILALAGNPARSFGHGTLLFLGCLAFEHKIPTGQTKLPALTKCTVGEAGDIKAPVLFHVVRNKAGPEGTAYVLVEAGGGLSENFTTIEFGPLCGALAEEVIEVKGSLVGEVLTNNANPIRIKEASETIQLLFKDKLLFGTNHALLDGVVQISPTGPAETIGVEAGA